jgi:hypothetical protein
VIRNQLLACSVENVALEKADAEIAHMKNAIHHLDLNVSDLERSGPFYDQLLTQIGFRRVNLSTPGEPGGFDWIAPGDKNARFSIGMYRATSPKQISRSACTGNPSSGSASHSPSGCGRAV